ncbi:MAG: ankyrin repeat domain-containing protein, partial [Gammaproteobacteria bacterium]
MNRIASFLLVLLGPFAASVADPIHDAASTGNIEQAGKLLDGGAGIESRGANEATPLILAALNGHASTVELLITRGA